MSSSHGVARSKWALLSTCLIFLSLKLHLAEAQLGPHQVMTAVTERPTQPTPSTSTHPTVHPTLTSDRPPPTTPSSHPHTDLGDCGYMIALTGGGTFAATILLVFLAKLGRHLSLRALIRRAFRYRRMVSDNGDVELAPLVNTDSPYQRLAVLTSAGGTTAAASDTTSSTATSSTSGSQRARSEPVSIPQDTAHHHQPEVRVQVTSL